MKKILIILTSVCAAVISFGFERDYIKEGILTSEQEETILKLAELHGITDVAKIETHFFHPGDERYITVLEAECIRGRVASFRRLNIGYTEWSRNGSLPHSYSVRLGDFWSQDVSSRHLNILRVGGNEFRVRIHGWRMETCERVLEALQKGEFALEEGVSSDDLRRINFDQPYSFLPTEGSDDLRVTFGDKSDRLVSYTLTINNEGDGITITAFDWMAI